MKFYIFGNTKKCSTIVANRKSAAFTSDDLNATLETYKNYINEVRFTNIYFIADFELFGSAGLFKKTVTLDEDNNPVLPFLVIGEWHNGENKDNIIRCDKTIITRKGFTHQFNDNLAALQEFLYCIDNHIKSEFSIEYSRTKIMNGVKTKCDYFRMIADSVAVVRNTKPKPINRIRLFETDWKTDFNIVDKSKFVMYKLEKPEEKKEKEDLEKDSRGTVIAADVAVNN